MFRGDIKTLNKSEYIDILTDSYMANPEAYIKEMRAAFRDHLSLFDTNTNSMIETEEYVRSFKVFGHVHDAADIAAFKVAFNGSDSVSLEEAVNISLQFQAGTMITAENDTIDEAIKTALREDL